MARARIIDGVAWPGVTSIIDQLDKSKALLPWAVNQALTYVENNMVQDTSEDGYVQDDDIPTILQKAKFEWRSVSREAMDIGTEVHDAIEQYIKHGKDVMGQRRKEVENAFLAFLEWEEKNGVIWLLSEQVLLDKTAGYQGTMDAVCIFTKGEYQGMVVALDFKSSKGFYDGYDLQIAAYRHVTEVNMITMAETLNFEKAKAYFSTIGIKVGELTPIPINGMGVLRLDKETGLPEYKDYSKNYDRLYKSFYQLVKFYYTYKKRRLKGNPHVG